MTNKKPIAKLIGADGNIFNLIGLASQTLRKAGLTKQIPELQSKVTSAKSYEEALHIISKYVDIR